MARLPSLLAPRAGDLLRAVTVMKAGRIEQGGATSLSILCHALSQSLRSTLTIAKVGPSAATLCDGLSLLASTAGYKA